MKTNDTAPAAASSSPTSLDDTPAAGIPAATTFGTAGAPHQVTDIDVSHPAVDNDPRAGTSVNQNRIDFNDPSLSSAEAVEQNLKAQK